MSAVLLRDAPSDTAAPRAAASPLARLLSDGGPVLADGGMGTMLMAAGLLSGDPPEEWNLRTDRREAVRDVHRAYQAAGAQILLTNSFGASPFRLALHGRQHLVHEVNLRAAELARSAATGRVVVAGSVGPSGSLFEPMGELTHALAVEGFAAQIAGLADGGVDVIWIETMSDLAEVQAAIEAARLAAPHLPVVATMTFDTGGFTMMGTSPAEAIGALAGAGLVAVGANCGTGSPEIERAVYSMHLADSEQVLVAKPNAGLPFVAGGQVRYGETPEVMAAHARRSRALGARIIGACCGSSPAHLRAIRSALWDLPPLIVDPDELPRPVERRTRAPRTARPRASSGGQPGSSAPASGNE